MPACGCEPSCERSAPVGVGRNHLYERNTLSFGRAPSASGPATVIDPTGADRLAPELWAAPRSTDHWPLVLFSEGPVVCPGQNLVLLLTSATLAALLEEREVHAVGGFEASRPLPSVLDPFGSSLQLRPAAAD